MNDADRFRAFRYEIELSNHCKYHVKLDLNNKHLLANPVLSCWFVGDGFVLIAICGLTLVLQHGAGKLQRRGYRTTHFSGAVGKSRARLCVDSVLSVSLLKVTRHQAQFV